eukprot:755065-Hanusia_phi.AAC.2
MLQTLTCTGIISSRRGSESEQFSRCICSLSCASLCDRHFLYQLMSHELLQVGASPRTPLAAPARNPAFALYMRMQEA